MYAVALKKHAPAACGLLLQAGSVLEWKLLAGSTARITGLDAGGISIARQTVKFGDIGGPQDRRGGPTGHGKRLTMMP